MLEAKSEVINMARFDFIEKRKKEIPKETRVFVSKTFDLLERINEIMKEKKISQRDLALRLNKKQSEISKWMNGTQNFTILTLSKLEVALGEDLITIPCQREKNQREGLINIFYLQKVSDLFSKKIKTEKNKEWTIVSMNKNTDKALLPISSTIRAWHFTGTEKRQYASIKNLSPKQLSENIAYGLTEIDQKSHGLENIKKEVIGN